MPGYRARSAQPAKEMEKLLQEFEQGEETIKGFLRADGDLHLVDLPFPPRGDGVATLVSGVTLIDGNARDPDHDR